MGMSTTTSADPGIINSFCPSLVLTSPHGPSRQIQRRNSISFSRIQCSTRPRSSKSSKCSWTNLYPCIEMSLTLGLSLASNCSNRANKQEQKENGTREGREGKEEI